MAAIDDTTRPRIPKQCWVVLATTVIGWVVTSLDLQLSAFLTPQITTSLNVSSAFLGNIFFVFAVGLALGAFVLGYFSDLWIGRKKAFLYSILGTIVLTGVTGLAENGWEFALIRFFAGVFSGGEWVLGLSILSEVAPQRHRSLMLGATQAGVGLGYGIANLFAATFAAPGVTPFGWRLAYWASFAFAALTYLVRLKVEESPYWKQLMRKQHDRSAGMAAVRTNIGELFRSRQRRLTLLAVGLFVIIGEPQGTWDFLYPSWFTHVGAQQMSGNTITYGYEIAIMAATLVGGWFMDRYSARWLTPVVWLAVPFSLLMWLAPHLGGVGGQAGFLFLAGFGRQAAWALVAAYFPVLFPTRLRGTGMGITWVGGWLFGYAASAAWGTAVQSALGWNYWWLLQVVLLLVIPLPMIMAGVETRGKSLDFMTEPAVARQQAAS